MNKYFICSDLHGFYNEFKKALNDSNFDINNEDHYLIICGDLFDRGKQAKELLKFLLEFQKTGRLILIRGNHEDLLEDCLKELEKYYSISNHHITNGTLDTIAQLTDINYYDLLTRIYDYKKLRRKLYSYFKLMKKALNYYGLNNYVFVHGWVPVLTNQCYPPYYLRNRDFKINKKWKEASDFDWKDARWIGYPTALDYNLLLKDKVIICGHWHCSYGWYKDFPDKYTEFGNNDCFELYKHIKDKTGFIAIDTCTPYSHKVNILVLEI